MDASDREIVDLPLRTGGGRSLSTLLTDDRDDRGLANGFWRYGGGGTLSLPELPVARPDIGGRRAIASPLLPPEAYG